MVRSSHMSATLFADTDKFGDHAGVFPLNESVKF